jgi:hypothetical protein
MEASVNTTVSEVLTVMVVGLKVKPELVTLTAAWDTANPQIAMIENNRWLFMG